MKNKTLKRVFVLFACVLIVGCMAVPVFATASTESVDVAVSAVQAGLDEVTETITIGNVVTIVLAAIGGSVLFVFFWWGLRKVISAVMAAFRKGRIKV